MSPFNRMYLRSLNFVIDDIKGGVQASAGRKVLL